MDTRVHMFAGEPAFNSLSVYLEVVLLCHVIALCFYLRNHQTVSHSACTSFYPEQGMRTLHFSIISILKANTGVTPSSRTLPWDHEDGKGLGEGAYQFWASQRGSLVVAELGCIPAEFLDPSLGTNDVFIKR